MPRIATGGNRRFEKPRSFLSAKTYTGDATSSSSSHHGGLRSAGQGVGGHTRPGRGTHRPGGCFVDNQRFPEISPSGVQARAQAIAN